jgi:hypothetical protein
MLLISALTVPGAVHQLGEHHHEITAPVLIGPFALRAASQFALLVVAGFAPMKPFLPAPGRRISAVVCGSAVTAVLLELLLVRRLQIPQRTVPLVLALAAGPLVMTLARTPRLTATVRWAHRAAPYVLTLAACGAFAMFALAWAGDGGSATVSGRLHTGIMLGACGLAWLTQCRIRPAVAAALVYSGAVLLALAVVKSSADVMALVAAARP